MRRRRKTDVEPPSLRLRIVVLITSLALLTVLGIGLWLRRSPVPKKSAQVRFSVWMIWSFSFGVASIAVGSLAPIGEASIAEPGADG